MFTWENVKNPAEVKRYAFDWTSELATNDTVASASASLITAAGLTIVQDDETSDTQSFVKVSGGTAGQTALIQGTVVTTNGETFVEVGELTIAEAYTIPPSSLTELQTDLASLRQARIALLTGGSIKEVTRDGRKIVYSTITLADINTAIKEYERLIAEAQYAEAGTRRPYRALKPRFN